MTERDSLKTDTGMSEASLHNLNAADALQKNEGPGARVILAGSGEKAVSGKLLGVPDPDEVLNVTVMLRPKTSKEEFDSTVKQVQAHERPPLSDAEIKERFGADPAALSRLEKFARQYNLTTQNVNVEAGQVVLQGNVHAFDRAFGIGIRDFKIGRGQAREYMGNLSLPKGIAGDVLGILGLDTRVKAKPLSKFFPVDQSGAGSQGYMPSQVADAYNFPAGTRGLGQSVGIVELGGGWDAADNAQYYMDHGLVVPDVHVARVDGAYADPGFHEDSEVNLDSQVLGTVAPDANQQIIFAPNTAQGLVDAITRATFPAPGEMQNSAISISWGARESFWSKQEIDSIDGAIKKAALKGISVFAAAGDSGATDGDPAGQPQTDFPASDPLVTGCGGTELFITPREEVAWNDGSDYTGATGGGISNVFPVPDYQKGISMPPNINHQGPVTGRGVPDVVGDAAPETGYRVRLHGVEYVGGGTSAVAPLYAGLVVRINSALDQPVGDFNTFVYKNRNTGIFRDITLGDNNGYKATAGWNPVTGNGSVHGTRLYDELKARDVKPGQSVP